MERASTTFQRDDLDEMLKQTQRRLTVARLRVQTDGGPLADGFLRLLAVEQRDLDRATRRAEEERAERRDTLQQLDAEGAANRE